MSEQIRILELEEYLMAEYESKQQRTREDKVQNLRSILYSHRFFIFTWLMMNGVGIPANLVSDQLHKRPGEQSVDKPVQPPLENKP